MSRNQYVNSALVAFFIATTLTLTQTAQASTATVPFSVDKQHCVPDHDWRYIKQATWNDLSKFVSRTTNGYGGDEHPTAVLIESRLKTGWFLTSVNNKKPMMLVTLVKLYLENSPILKHTLHKGRPVEIVTRLVSCELKRELGMKYHNDVAIGDPQEVVYSEETTVGTTIEQSSAWSTSVEHSKTESIGVEASAGFSFKGVGASATTTYGTETTTTSTNSYSLGVDKGTYKETKRKLTHTREEGNGNFFGLLPDIEGNMIDVVELKFESRLRGYASLTCGAESPAVRKSCQGHRFWPRAITVLMDEATAGEKDQQYGFATELKTKVAVVVDGNMSGEIRVFNDARAYSDHKKELDALGYKGDAFKSH